MVKRWSRDGQEMIKRWSARATYWNVVIAALTIRASVIAAAPDPMLLPPRWRRFSTALLTSRALPINRNALRADAILAEAELGQLPVDLQGLAAIAVAPWSLMRLAATTCLGVGGRRRRLPDVDDHAEAAEAAEQSVEG
eukprot:4480160-Prymnesium_polylepis.1